MIVTRATSATPASDSSISRGVHAVRNDANTPAGRGVPGPGTLFGAGDVNLVVGVDDDDGCRQVSWSASVSAGANTPGEHCCRLARSDRARMLGSIVDVTRPRNRLAYSDDVGVANALTSTKATLAISVRFEGDIVGSR